MIRMSICRQASVKKEPCINGKRSVRITNFIRQNGVCRPFSTTTNLYCGLNRKEFCTCSAVGGLHYRTYDGQGIHFYGDCRYTLSKYINGRNSCSFNIEIKNRFRGKLSQHSYSRSIIIHMFGEKYELGPRKSLKIGNVRRSIPYERNADVRIFYSNDFVQFVAPKCSVSVAFNGKSNAFVRVSKTYSGKMTGICGNCNGIHDDYRTKSGKDVSKSKNKYARIANSYSMASPGKHCKPAAHITYENICGRYFYQQAKLNNICRHILTSNNPFTKCGQQAYVDLKNFYQDCLLDLCVNKNRPEKIKKIQCEILEGLAESCAESGVPGIGWRIYFNCPKKCGKNQHFSQKASPCPRTCENHFFGTRRPCYDLPEREGCECNKGYIRDGALCVKPMHCKCMSLCTDRKSSASCKKWKQRGDCQKFQESMNLLCPKTCGFCKLPGFQCDNQISTERCRAFRRKGLCFHEFYRSICGLTCNYDKCKCGHDETIIGKCDRSSNIITTTHYSYTRDSKGRCAKLVRQTYQPCPCPTSGHQYGRCNFCTGKRKITNYYYEVVKYKCVIRFLNRYEICEKCLKNPQVKTDCLNDRYLRTTIMFQKVVKCYQCLQDRSISTTEIKCKSSKRVKVKGCHTYITTIIRRPLNCRCQEVIKRKRIICCHKKWTETKCQNKQLIHMTHSYKKIREECHPYMSYKIQIPACPIKNTVTFGTCIIEEDGYGRATDIQEITGVRKNCTCFLKIVKHIRLCKCREPLIRKYKRCHRESGVLTTITEIETLIKIFGNFKCPKKIYRSSIIISFQTKYSRKFGICQPNCIRSDKIYKTFRDGCKIVTKFSHYSYQLCCCRKKIKIKTKCVFQTKVLTEYKCIIKNNQRVYVPISRKEIRISCPPPKEISKCVKLTRTITRISYYVKNCQCQKLERVEVFSPCCKHKIISQDLLPCDGKKYWTYQVTRFLGEDCEYGTKVCSVECCVKPYKRTDSRCNPNTGQIVKSIKTFKFDRKILKCQSKTSINFISIKCNKVRIVKHRCGQERKNYRKITIITEHLSKQSCSCKRTENSIWKCCKLPKGSVKEMCRGSYFDVEIISYKFGKNKRKCIRKIRRNTKIVQCPIIRHQFRIEPISKCRYKRFTYYYRIENCKCKLKNSFEIFYSRCCQKPTTSVRCHKQKYSVKITRSFHLSSDKRKCIKYEYLTSQLIKCPYPTKSWTTKRLPNCKYSLVTDYFHVKNCKCQKLRRKVQKKLWSCCQKPITKVTCESAKIWRTTTETFTLVNNEKCIKKQSIVDRVTKCPDSYAVVCPCAKFTNLKSIKRFYYVIVNCKCEMRRIYIPCVCSQVPNKVKLGYCDSKTLTRTVKVFTSVLENERCRWKLLISYQDPCDCWKIPLRTNCLAHSIWRTIQISCKLTKIASLYPRHKRVKSKIVTDKLVVCNRDYSYVTPCVNHMKRKVQCTYKSVNCKCELSCREIASRPCPCNKFDKCRTKCIRNVKVSKCIRHKAIGMACVSTRTSLPIVERCSPIRKTKCVLQREYINDCLYSSCKTKFFIYQDCRCVKDKKVINTCIECRKPKETIKCVNNLYVIKTINFILNEKYNQCIPKESTRFRKIECPRWKVRETVRDGYKYYTVTYYKVVNCLCIKIHCRESYFRKRCPFSKVKKECINNRWVYTFIDSQIRFTHERLCPDIETGLKKKMCLHNYKTKIEPVTCPPNYKITKCNLRKNVKIEEEHIFKAVNCKCIKIVNRKLSCGKCRDPIIIESPCGPINRNGIGYITVKTKFWAVNEKKKCVPVHIRFKKIGCCRKDQTIQLCQNGKKIYKTFRYEVRFKCQPKITMISMPIYCYNNGQPNKWRVVKKVHCRSPGEYTVKYLERMSFNPNTCGCHRQTKSVRTTICCGKCWYRTECRHHNKIVHIANCQRPVNLKCITYEKERVYIKSCPKTQRQIIGDCKGSVISYRITSYRSINCKCREKEKVYMIIKERDRIDCVSNMWRRTHIGYQRIHNRCVAKRPVITFKRITCSTAEIYVDRRINDCNFSRSYFKKVVSNCRCVNRLIRTEILHYKCCQKPTEFRRCIKDKTIKISITKYNFVNFRCYPILNEIRIRVDCSRVKVIDIIPTGRCTYNKLKYLAIPRNCVCIRRLKKTTRNLCKCAHHLKPTTQQSCDAENGRYLIVKTSFKCVNRKILTIKEITAKPVNCDRNVCKNIYSPCIRNTQTIQLLCLRREGCQCKKKFINQRNICCGPRANSLWTEIGPCNIKREKCYYKLIKTFALKLNFITKVCQPVLVNQQYKICRTPDSFIITSCLKDIYIKKIFVSYQINYINNVCDEIKRDSISVVEPCHTSFHIKISEKEISREGLCRNKYKRIYPRNCKCHEKIFEETKTCTCLIKRIPPTQTINYCLKNYIRVVEIKTPKCVLSNIYWTSKKQFYPVLGCTRKQIIFGNQFRLGLTRRFRRFRRFRRYRRYGSRRHPRHSNGRKRYCVTGRYDTHLQWFVKNCNCERKIIGNPFMCIKCLPPHRHEKCLVSTKIITNYSYFLVKGHCQRSVSQQKIHIPCPRSPKVIRSPCYNNLYTLSTFFYFYRNCRCESQLVKKTCHCKCSSNKKSVQCSRNYLLNEITTKYYKKDCKCLKTETIRQIEPHCPRYVRKSLGKCLRKTGGHSYRKVTTRYLRKCARSCRCSVVKKSKLKICKCSEEVRKQKLCINNNRIYQTLKWVIIESKNRCELKVSESLVKFVKCPPSTFVKIRYYNKEVCKSVRVTYRLTNCKCIKNKVVKRFPCPCKKVVLIMTGKCSPRTFKHESIRFDTYQHKEVRGKKCVTFNEKRKELCSCRLDKKIRFCRFYHFVNLHFTYKKIGNICSKSRTQVNDYIRCPTKIRVTRSACHNDYQVIFYKKKFVSNCKCRLALIRSQLCRCRCPHDRVFTKCDKHFRSKIIKTHFSYKLVNCQCLLRSTITIIPITCPPPSIEVSKCSRFQNTNYYIKTITNKRYIIKRCGCRLITVINKKICCILTKSSNVFCDQKNQALLTINSETVYKSEKCVVITHKTRQPITCDNKWRLVNRPVCHPDGNYGTQIRIYQKLVFRNCGCELKTKTKKCNCVCTGPSVIKKCEGNLINIYFYKYKLNKCKCWKYLKDIKQKPIEKCERKRIKVGMCFKKNQKCVKYVIYNDPIVSNCKCHERLRTVEEPCKLCCGNPISTKQCNKETNQLITRTKTCHITKCGCIHYTNSVRKSIISCEEKEVCKSKSGCDSSRNIETIDCEKTFLKDCVCETKHESITGTCPCGPNTIKYGKCNKQTCVREIRKVENKLVLLINGKKQCHEEIIKIKDEICCCPESKTTRDCTNNKLIETVKRYKFNEQKKQCDESIHTKDLTPDCEPAIKTIPETCDPITFEFNIREIRKQLFNCKCSVTESTSKKLCRCKDHRTEEKCVQNQWEISIYQYTLTENKEKCDEKITKSYRSISCPETKTETLVIREQELCQQTTYSLINCVCVPTVTNIGCTCKTKCPKDTFSETCDSARGILRTTVSKSEQDESGSCITNTNDEDKQIKCLETPKIEISKATQTKDNGIYTVTYIYNEQRKDCKCIKETSVKYELQRCEANSAIVSCIGNINVTKEISYYKVKATELNYDFKCVIKEETVNGIMNCPSNSSTLIENDYTSVTYYVIEGCKCVPKIDKIKAPCKTECKITYCTEDRTQCSTGKCNDESNRASCPITCGICVECKDNTSTCEKNPYDDKFYIKK